MLNDIIPSDSEHHRQIAEIWNRACGNCFTFSQAFVRYNLEPVRGLLQAGRFALDQQDVPAGFVIASVLTDDPNVSPPTHGWIEAIAVLPEYQTRGHGKVLLDWAERWLVEQGCNEASLGAGIRTFVPGLPPDLLSEPFFRARGYANIGEENGNPIWDVAADLANYESPASVLDVDAVAHAAKPGDETTLLAFLHREFPGRWRFEAADFLERGGRISDFMLLWTERGVDGFCWLTFEDSSRPIERYFPYGLPRPWGQMGPIGISADRRERGYGSAVLDAGLRRLRDNGIRGCVIDWTTLLDFYTKFGFSQYREYLPLSKRLD